MRHGFKPTPLAERFARHVNKTDDLFSCWLWTGYTSPSGYGRIAKGDRHPILAHRLAWIITYGPIPKGLLVLHRCDTPACVRPDHLFLGTQRDNVQDMILKGRDGLRGERNHWSKFTNEQVQEIRRSNESGTTLAKRFNVRQSAITKIRQRQAWKHVS